MNPPRMNPRTLPQQSQCLLAQERKERTAQAKLNLAEQLSIALNLSLHKMTQTKSTSTRQNQIRTTHHQSIQTLAARHSEERDLEVCLCAAIKCLGSRWDTDRLPGINYDPSVPPALRHLITKTACAGKWIRTASSRAFFSWAIRSQGHAQKLASNQRHLSLTNERYKGLVQDPLHPAQQCIKLLHRTQMQIRDHQPL